MRRHVEVPRLLRLPERFRRAQEYLWFHDADLRLRRSLEQPWFYVLERRCRRAPAVNRGIRLGSDMHLQARDGYIHVGLVHPSLLMRPWRIVERLQEQGADLWAAGGAQRVEDEAIYEARWQRETRKRRRRDLFRDITRDAADALERTGFFGGMRTRISNAGSPATV
jgi:hypothetical protein